MSPAGWFPTRRVRAGVAFALALTVAPSSAHASPCWLPPVEAPVIEPFREPPCRWCAGHRGISYDTVPGHEVRAVAAGTVTFAGVVVGVRYVVVRHANGWRVTYGGLADIAVADGDTVVARTVVGSAGETLHVGLRDGETYLDPAPYLGVLVRTPRLVPLDGGPSGPAGRSTIRCAASPSSSRADANDPDRR